jgi:hypothetical protein
MADGWEGSDRRRHPRVSLNGEVRGKIHTEASAPVINLSLTGALLEVPCTLQVGASYTLRLALHRDRFVDVKGKVVRSYVHGFDKNEKGEMFIKYRAAIQFQSVGDAQREALDKFLQGIENAAVRAELQANPPV